MARKYFCDRCREEISDDYRDGLDTTFTPGGKSVMSAWKGDLCKDCLRKVKDFMSDDRWRR
jgi:hypothetical protein